MDWSLFKSILEAVVILVVLPGASIHLFRTQRSRLEAQRRLLEEKDAALCEAEAELAATKKKFRAFSDEVTARNRRAWARFVEEGAAFRALRELLPHISLGFLRPFQCSVRLRDDTT